VWTIGEEGFTEEGGLRIGLARQASEYGLACEKLDASRPDPSADGSGDYDEPADLGGVDDLLRDIIMEAGPVCGLWPGGGEVQVSFDPATPPAIQAELSGLLESFVVSLEGGVRFVPLSSSSADGGVGGSYAFFAYTDGGTACVSPLTGRRAGRRTINVAGGCGTPRSLALSLGFVLGLSQGSVVAILDTNRSYLPRAVAEVKKIRSCDDGLRVSVGSRPGASPFFSLLSARALLLYFYL
jgi:hypothetical protein